MTTPPTYTITLEDVQAYLDSKSDDEDIGVTCSSGSCIVAEALCWKYAHIADISASVTTEMIFLIDGSESEDIEISDEIRALIDRFDDLGTGFLGSERAVTKREWLAARGEVRV